MEIQVNPLDLAVTTEIAIEVAKEIEKNHDIAHLVQKILLPVILNTLVQINHTRRKTKLHQKQNPLLGHIIVRVHLNQRTMIPAQIAQLNGALGTAQIEDGAVEARKVIREV